MNMRRALMLPLRFGVFAALGVLLLACQAEDPRPKQRQSSRLPVNLPWGRPSASATVPQEPSFNPYAPWPGYQPSWQTGSTPGYSMPPDRAYTGVPWPHEPTAIAGHQPYKGYRFRPVETEDHTPPAYGEPAVQLPVWDAPETYGMQWRDGSGSALDPGRSRYAPTPGLRFRPLEAKSRDRSQSGTRFPYFDAAPYQDSIYPDPLQDLDVYGFQPYAW